MTKKKTPTLAPPPAPAEGGRFIEEPLLCRGAGPASHRFLCLDCGAALEVNCHASEEDPLDWTEPDFALGHNVLSGVDSVAKDLGLDPYQAVRFLLAAGLQAVGRGVNARDFRFQRVREHLAAKAGPPAALKAV